MLSQRLKDRVDPISIWARFAATDLKKILGLLGQMWHGLVREN